MAIHLHNETASAATRKKEARPSQKQVATHSSWRTQELFVAHTGTNCASSRIKPFKTGTCLG